MRCCSSRRLRPGLMGSIYRHLGQVCQWEHFLALRLSITPTVFFLVPKRRVKSGYVKTVPDRNTYFCFLLAVSSKSLVCLILHMLPINALVPKMSPRFVGDVLPNASLSNAIVFGAVFVSSNTLFIWVLYCRSCVARYANVHSFATKSLCRIGPSRSRIGYSSTLTPSIRAQRLQQFQSCGMPIIGMITSTTSTNASMVLHGQLTVWPPRFTGRYPWAVEAAFKKYGDVVRIAPSEIAFFRTEAQRGMLFNDGVVPSARSRSLP